MSEQEQFDQPLTDGQIPPFIEAHQKPAAKGQQSMLEMINTWIEIRTMHERIKHNCEPLVSSSLRRVEEPIEMNGVPKTGYMLTVIYRPEMDPDPEHYWGTLAGFLEEDANGHLVALHTRQDKRED